MLIVLEKQKEMSDIEYAAHNSGLWYCEYHPEFEMGHDGCIGPGVPLCARISFLVLHRRLARQDLKEYRAQTGHTIYQLSRRIKELESQINNAG